MEQHLTHADGMFEQLLTYADGMIEHGSSHEECDIYVDVILLQ